MALEEPQNGQLHSAATLLSSHAPSASLDNAALPPSSQSLTPQGSSSAVAVPSSADAAAPSSQANQTTEPEQSRTNLIINYIPSDMTQDYLRTLFEPYGQIKSCKLMVDRVSEKSLGYGFVDFMEPEAAQAAIDGVNHRRLGNKVLKVSIARPSSSTITNANLYVKGLPPGTEEAALTAMFEPCGEIISVRVLREPNGSPKGVGFVRFDQRAQAEKAIEEFHGSTPAGCTQPMIVKFADNAKSRANSTNMSMAAMMSSMPPTLGFNPGYLPPSPTLGSPGGSPGFADAGMQGVPHSAITPQGICLFVYNLPADINEEQLHAMCQPYAHVTVTNIIRHRDTGAGKGYGFVTVTSVGEAFSVIESLNGCNVQGRNLQVSFKTERRRSSSNPNSMTPPAHYMTLSQPMSPYATMAASPYGGGSPPATTGIYHGMPPHSPVSPQMAPAYGWGPVPPHPGMMSPPAMGQPYTMLYEQPPLGSLVYSAHSPTALGPPGGYAFASSSGPPPQ
eukprot:m.53656 g.53656  ORF g.53656 m.53656 type:complete len:505 (+) comp13575_c1_seq1:238-1752(+)